MPILLRFKLVNALTHYSTLTKRSTTEQYVLKFELQVGIYFVREQTIKDKQKYTICAKCLCPPTILHQNQITTNGTLESQS